MTNWRERLKAEFDRNPLQTVAIGALAVTAAARFLDALTSAQSRRAYAKQIDRRGRYP